MVWQLIQPEDFLLSTWSGGETRQIAIAPKGALYGERSFHWRLSVATVAIPESDFTPLPDYMRVSAILKGSMRLSHDGGPAIDLKPFTPHAFDGGLNTHAWGQCSDLNLMTRKGTCQGSMAAIHIVAGDTLRLDAQAHETLLLFAAKGACTAYEQPGIIAMDEGACLHTQADTPGSLRVHSDKGCILLLSRVTYDERNTKA